MRAARDRCREEKEILEQELKRTFLSFTRYQEVWSTLAVSQNVPGMAAYAFKTANVYQRLSKMAEEACTK